MAYDTAGRSSFYVKSTHQTIIVVFMAENIPLPKRIIFYLITFTLLGALVLLVPVGYYTYRYLTYQLDYCAPFGLLDDKIGWTLAPSTTSCLNGFEKADGRYVFESSIFINADGARAPSIDHETSVGGILIIGDSYSFGHGVSYEDTFAAALEKYHSRPAAVFASPAYSTLQASSSDTKPSS